MRRWRNLPARRGRFYSVPASAVPSVPPPRIIRQAGALRFSARMLPSARRTWGPVIRQGNQGQAWPSFMRQPGTRTRFTVRSARGRHLDPGWGQSAVIVPQQGTATVTNALAASAAISNVLAGTVTIVNDL